MKLEEALKLIADAKARARQAARASDGEYAARNSSIVNAARLAVIEGLLCAYAAQGRDGDESGSVKTALELRDYWELVAQTIETGGVIAGATDGKISHPHHAGCALDSDHLDVCADAAGNLLYRRGD